MNGWGAGLAALAFWGFIAAVSIAGIRDRARKRDAQHETLRRLIDSGKPIDPEAMDILLERQQPGRMDRDLRVAAIIVLSLAPGLGILGVFIGQVDHRALLPMLGAAALLLCLGTGLWGASTYMRRSLHEDDARNGQPPRGI
jgi:hypothetical protein